MREGIVSAFQQVLSEEPGWRADVEGLHFKCLSSSEAETLEVQFSEEEIYAALMGMNGDKAPGPDGFTIAFGNQVGVLIPKKGGAEDLGDFRPISLLGSLYKLLAKCWSKWVWVEVVGVDVVVHLYAKFSVMINGAATLRERGRGDGGFRLRINLDKSVLIPVGEVENIEELAVELGCKIGMLPLCTWGCPLVLTTKLSPFGMGWKRE
ncbi:hypothetical protein CK203_092203 [Vitis vinifera]|uniref:Reverse transcriptase domain-containing protein n=1 Tax=Vitis vinifera TaxID=29760 RepID=A0A438F288_VITVI|nr:hypothetical protein CK203_092203 [Vitis vinifera]